MHLRLLAAAAAVIVLASAGPLARAGAADFPIVPIVPVSPIDDGFTPIDPIGPITGSAGTSTATGPAAPAAPQAPTLPDVPDLDQVTARMDAITTKVAALTQRVTGAALGDGQSFDAAASTDAISTLDQARSMFASQDVAPQVSVGADGCPTSVPDGSLRGGAEALTVAQLCADSVAAAATPEAALAVKWAFSQLGSPYACGGVGRMQPHKFDCSSLVTRAYSEGAGLDTATSTWAPSTRDLMPWGGTKLADWAAEVAPENIRPGDLLVYRTCTDEPCSYQHVTMALADGYMLHTNRCGDVAHVTASWGTGPDSKFAVARRVDPSKAR